MAKSKKIYKSKITNTDLILVKSDSYCSCRNCIIAPPEMDCSKDRPTDCVKLVFGNRICFHFEKAF